MPPYLKRYETRVKWSSGRINALPNTSVIQKEAFTNFTLYIYNHIYIYIYIRGKTLEYRQLK